MSKVLVENSTLVNIAEAIRNQSENNFEMLPSEMPGHILNIDTEKVIIDDYKATEIMNLYSFQNQVILEVDAPPAKPSGYSYKGKLYDGSKLYMKTTLTTVTDGSSSSSAGCTGTVLLIKPNGTQLSIDIPTYTIPSRSETGSSPDSYRYSCELYLSPDGDVYLRLQREFEDIYGISSIDHKTYYQSIYKLNIDTSSLSWTNKVIEVSLGFNIEAGSGYIIEDNYIYVAGYNRDNKFTRYIYGYKYNDTSYEFQKISTNSIYHNTVTIGHPTVFMRKNTNTYIYFWGAFSSSSDPIDDWISITRNSDDTYTESKGTASFNGYRKSWKSFMLNGDVYIQALGRNGYSGYEGFHIYKLNSDNSAWEVVYNIENATSGDTKINTYLDNTLDTIFQGKSSTTIRDDGTFDLIEFPPGSSLQHRLQIPTPTVAIKNYETWYYRSYRYNNIGQKIFFFLVEIESLDSRYKCVLEAIDGRPVLYSTFRESDITE